MKDVNVIGWERSHEWKKRLGANSLVSLALSVCPSYVIQNFLKNFFFLLSFLSSLFEASKQLLTFLLPLKILLKKKNYSERASEEKKDFNRKQHAQLPFFNFSFFHIALESSLGVWVMRLFRLCFNMIWMIRCALEMKLFSSNFPHNFYNKLNIMKISTPWQ